jgi:hypothetical protein
MAHNAQENSMSEKRQQAKSNLIYYMRLLAKSSGVGWNYENESEIGDIVDLIIDAAIAEVAEVEKEALLVAEEGNVAMDDYRYRRAQAEAWAKAERGE